MRHQLLPTGRLSYFPSARYLGDNRFRTLDGAEHTVTVRRRVVDATYLLDRGAVDERRRRSPLPTGSTWSPRTTCRGGRPTSSTTRSSAAARPGWTAACGCCATASRRAIALGHAARLLAAQPRQHPAGAAVPQSASRSVSTRMVAIPEADLAGRPLHPAGGRPEPAAPRPDGVAVDVPLRHRVARRARAVAPHHRCGQDGPHRPRGTRIEMVLRDRARFRLPAPSLYVDCTTPGLPASTVGAGVRRRPDHPAECAGMPAGVQRGVHRPRRGDLRRPAHDVAPATPFANRFRIPTRRIDWLRILLSDNRAQIRWVQDPELMDWLKSSRLNVAARSVPAVPGDKPRVREKAIGALDGAL